MSDCPHIGIVKLKYEGSEGPEKFRIFCDDCKRMFRCVPFKIQVSYPPATHESELENV